MRLASSEYKRLYALPGMTGRGGYRTLTFEVIGPGQGDLILFYTRLAPTSIEKAVEEGRQEEVEADISKVIPVVAN